MMSVFRIYIMFSSNAKTFMADSTNEVREKTCVELISYEGMGKFKMTGWCSFENHFIVRLEGSMEKVGSIRFFAPRKLDDGPALDRFYVADDEYQAMDEETFEEWSKAVRAGNGMFTFSF